MKAFLALMLLALCAVSARAQAAGRTGYLTAATTPDVVSIVPPAPETGDARFIADMAIFRTTRSMENSPRWTVAQSDDNVSTAGLFKAFSCSLGVNVTRENAPKTTELVVRAGADAGRAAGILKTLYGHKRPFQVEDAKVCLSPQGKAALEKSPDYPSGHTTASWEAGLVLAELVPDKATAILTRAREFGESRVVCGVHNVSAVAAGWITATAIFSAQQSSPEFRADVDAARSELTLLMKQPSVDPQACSAEREVLSKRPY